MRVDSPGKREEAPSECSSSHEPGESGPAPAGPEPERSFLMEKMVEVERATQETHFGTSDIPHASVKIFKLPIIVVIGS